MPDEFEAAALGVPPLLPDYAPDPRHLVKGHDRTIPPKPVDPNVLHLDLGEAHATPEPRPRKVPVKPHHRRNPRPKENQTVTTITGPGRAASMAAARARATDPSTSHAAAASIDVNRSQVEVLAAFLGKWQDDQVTFLPEYVQHGFTDEAMVAWLDERETRFSPSRLRTARRELTDLGLLEDSGEDRPTKRGRAADVYVFTPDGLAFAKRP